MYGSEWDKTWSVDRRICSATYFEKYFVYSVRNGSISDVKFNSLLDELKNEDIDEAVRKLEDIFIINGEVNIDIVVKFLEKVEANLTLGKFEEKQSEILIYCLARIERIIPNQYYALLSIHSRLAITIWHLLQLRPKEATENIITRAINTVESLMFCVELLRWIAPPKGGKQDFFTEDESERIASVIIERIKIEIQNESFLDTYKISSSTLLHSILNWGNDDDKAEVGLKIKEWIEEPNGAEKVIFGFSRLIHTSNVRQPTVIEFKRDSYDELEKIINPQEIVDVLMDKYQENPSGINIDDNNTDYEKVAIKFLKLHQKIKDKQS